MNKTFRFTRDYCNTAGQGFKWQIVVYLLSLETALKRLATLLRYFIFRLYILC